MVKSVCGLGFDMKKLDIKGVMVEVVDVVGGCGGSGSRCRGGGGSSANNATLQDGGVVVVRRALVG